MGIPYDLFRLMCGNLLGQKLKEVKVIEFASSWFANTVEFDLLTNTVGSFYVLQDVTFISDSGNAAGGVNFVELWNLGISFGDPIRSGYIVGTVVTPQVKMINAICSFLRHKPGGITSAFQQNIFGFVYHVFHT